MSVLLADRPMFDSFFMGGFECSTQRMPPDGHRLDMLADTGHDRYVVADYLRLKEQGIRTAREGLRWHLIERASGIYDFSSVLPMLRAARDEGIQVIWDVCHFGWPDFIDIFKPEFIHHFAGLARAFTKLHLEETDRLPFFAPINEISFVSWACGEVGIFYPFAKRRGDELKAQLVRAAIAGVEAIWEIQPKARIVHTDPLIHIVPDPAKPRLRAEAEQYRLAQYQAWDMIAGRLRPELGGNEKYLDILGGNFYVHNEWIYGGQMIPRTHPGYRPFRKILREVYDRYRRPIFLAETGVEDAARPEWLRYIGREVRASLRAGVQFEGICWYPIINHPGWADARHCHNGLWDYPPDESGERETYEPLAREIQRQRRLFRAVRHSA